MTFNPVKKDGTDGEGEDDEAGDSDGNALMMVQVIHLKKNEERYTKEAKRNYRRATRR